MGIFNYFLRNFSGNVYDDPITWDNGIFSADAETALLFYSGGLEEIADLALDTYEIPAQEYLRSAVSLQGKPSEHFTPESLKAVHYLWEDLHLFCPPLTNTGGAKNDWVTREKLKKRHLRYSSQMDARPFDYAVGEDKFTDFRDKLLEIDQNYLYAALQKYPVSPAVIDLRAQLYRAICRPPSVASDWQRALDHLEYKTEIQVRADYEARNLVPTSEELTIRLFMELEKNPEYLQVSAKFFNRLSVETENLQILLRKSKEAFEMHGKWSYLQKYLATQLQIVRSSSREEAKIIFEELFYLNIEGLSREPDYVYVLAESAWRAGERDKALAIVRNILRDGIYRDQLDYRKILRLKFILENA